MEKILIKKLKNLFSLVPLNNESERIHEILQKKCENKNIIKCVIIKRVNEYEYQ